MSNQIVLFKVKIQNSEEKTVSGNIFDLRENRHMFRYPDSIIEKVRVVDYEFKDSSA